jgi:hypothetical protein
MVGAISKQVIIFIIRETVQPSISGTESIKPSLNIMRLLLSVMPSKNVSLVPQIREITVIKSVPEGSSEVVINGITSHFFLRT